VKLTFLSYVVLWCRIKSETTHTYASRAVFVTTAPISPGLGADFTVSIILVFH
jgi:hypothetical protein